MTIRERLEAREEQSLVICATRSAGAHRARPEASSTMRTEFQRDRDRIIHTSSFRRLMHKTQVFIGQQGGHHRTRLTHTLEVSQIARTIGRALGLNEDLIEAIAMGHDLGHTPYGHAGERALATCYPNFRHNEQSLRIVDRLEHDGTGLNLTDPVREGILRHSKGRASLAAAHSLNPATPEGHVVKLADGIAYMNHDLDDALRSGMIHEAEIPPRVIRELGGRHSQRINTLVEDLIITSDVAGETATIAMSAATLEVADILRNFLYERVYDPINQLASTIHCQDIVKAHFAYFLAHQDEIPADVPTLEGETADRRVADYVASMTDWYATELYQKVHIPAFLVP